MRVTNWNNGDNGTPVLHSTSFFVKYWTVPPVWVFKRTEVEFRGEISLTGDVLV